ncbi:MAG TPA: hypothetical protein VNZ53_28065 [Steroidobacteraceae bacterium]|nr:hypothetical protein [Steroidobacteraceae bacterium]
MKTVQFFCYPVQFPRRAGEGLRDRLNKYSLDRHHLHFLRTLADCTSDGAKLKDQIGTVDFENIVLIEPRIESLRKIYTLSSIPSFAWF